MSARGDQRKLLRKLRQAKCSIEVSGRSHYRIRLPGGDLIVLPNSPSDNRALKNAKALLRRKGIKT